MKQSIEHEAKRLSIQTYLDSCKTALERNKLGQFATPSVLARELLAFALPLLPEGQLIRFLDPAIGLGSFYAALLETNTDKPLYTAKGYEIDPHYGEPAKKLWAGLGLDIELADFTKATPPIGGFNLLICNPPYVRHQHLKSDEKRQLQVKSQTTAGVKLSGLAGLYCYFLALSHSWMSPGGIAGWLIPSEFMDVNYGQELKRYLLEEVTLVRIHRFDPEEVQFNDALVSSAVVWFKRDKPPLGHTVEFSYGGTHADPIISRNISTEALANEAKWTRFPRKEIRTVANTPILSDLFDIRRGIATGSNDFFILTRQRIEELQLPMECFRPILPSPRHVETNEINSDKQGNPMLPQPLFLLDCRLPEQEVRKHYPTLWRYLELGKEEIALRYLCKSRPIWYQQENRHPTLFVCTYMGRRDSRTGRPFRFLLNHSKAIVANSYLMLYPKPSVTHRISQTPELTRLLWQALNEIPVESLTDEGRVYGGGLHKLEPKEMANLPATYINELLAIHSNKLTKISQ